MLYVKVGVDVGSVSWVGVWGEADTVTTWSPSEVEAPVLRSISKLIFSSEKVEVVRLDATVAHHRYSSGGCKEIFAFPVHSQSTNSVLCRKKLFGTNPYSYCFVLKEIELIPFNLDECIVAPVAFVVITDDCSMAPKLYSALSDVSGHNPRLVEEFGRILGQQVKANEPPLLAGELWFSLQMRSLLPEIVVTVLVALLMEIKVMISSEWQSKRAECVLGIVGILASSMLPWPHPVLASPPGEIARELAHAPTPVFGAVSSRSSFPPDCLVVNADVGLIVSGLSKDLESAVSEFSERMPKFRQEVVDLEFIQSMHKRISEVVVSLSELGGSMPFKERAKLIEERFPTSPLYVAVFKSQAFQLRCDLI